MLKLSEFEEKTEPVYSQYRLRMVSCTRCGADAFSEEAWMRRVERGRGDGKLCSDCERVINGPITAINYQIPGLHGVCRTWQGDFDRDDNPLDKHGNRFAGDVALCGHKDCVTATHRPEMVGAKLRRGALSRSQIRRKKTFSLELWLAMAEGSRQL